MIGVVKSVNGKRYVLESEYLSKEEALDRVKLLKDAYPGLPIGLGEVGWSKERKDHSGIWDVWVGRDWIDQKFPNIENAREVFKGEDYYGHPKEWDLRGYSTLDL